MSLTTLSPAQREKLRAPTGPYRTQSLFFEKTLADHSGCVYTLKDQDHTYNGETYLSLYRLYMEMEDETEYEFAMAYFSGWDHWKYLTSLAWMKPYVKRWREELSLKLKARALKSIRKAAESETREGLSAARWLLEKGYTGSPEEKRGRPSKDAIKQAATEIALTEKNLEDDWSRITSKEQIN